MLGNGRMEICDEGKVPAMATAIRQYLPTSRFIGMRVGEVTIQKELCRGGERGGMIKFLAVCDHGHRRTFWRTDLYRDPNPECRVCHYGDKKHPLYRDWRLMLNNAALRELDVYPPWLIFPNFVADMGAKPNKKDRLVRINRKFGYAPLNCKWGLLRGLDHKGYVRAYTIHGVTKTMSDWSYICGVTRERMRQLFNKFPPEKAVLSYPSAVKWFEENGVMAKVVERFPMPDSFDKYLDGQIWELTKGEDFDCTPEQFRHAAYAAAKQGDIKIKTRILDNTVFIKAVK